ncbi:MAG: diaminopimelate epimerase [Geminicoccaceae bacterium]
MNGLPFRKMHGCGNDFVVIDGRSGALDLSPEAIRRIGDRHRGVGFDQLALLLPPETGGDVRVRFYNGDGTEAGACGNASRCVAALLFEELGRDEAVLETMPGHLPATRLADGRVRVGMAVPKFGWKDIPLAIPCDTAQVPLNRPPLGKPVAVSMGNPHAVFFVEDVRALDVEALGAELEKNPFFPQKANIGFAQMLGPTVMRLRVFERGAGLTLACGSGACAAMVAAVRRGLSRERVRVFVDGGELVIEWDGQGPVYMTGPWTLSFSGVLAPELTAP